MTSRIKQFLEYADTAESISFCVDDVAPFWVTGWFVCDGRLYIKAKQHKAYREPICCLFDIASCAEAISILSYGDVKDIEFEQGVLKNACNSIVGGLKDLKDVEVTKTIVPGRNYLRIGYPDNTPIAVHSFRGNIEVTVRTVHTIAGEQYETVQD